MSVNAGADGGALRRAAERGGRRKGWRAAVFLVVAAVAGLSAAILLIRYLEARTAAARVPTVPVVVANNDLPEATELREELIAVVQWPAASVPEGTSPDPAKLKGRVVVTHLGKGEPILERHLASADAGRGLAALLPPGMRAVAVRVNDVVGVAGFVHPGDNVDVIVTMRPSDAMGVPPVSKIVLQNVRVLAVGKEVQRTEREAAKPLPATVATLMVDSDDSERLALAASKGELLLSLRSGLDQELVETEGIIPPQLLRGTAVASPQPIVASTTTTMTRRPPRHKVAARAPEEKPKPEHDSVEIMRGDLFERRDFERKGQ